ncbi:MAG: GntR family transcriptional regulator [Nitrososphaerales archaeon]
MLLTDAQRAYSEIKERIVTTVMRPGAVIEEAALMSELGLGRTPVREALKLLEAEKLVVVSPRRGMFVADVSLTDLRELEEVRIELESLCVRLAVQRMAPWETEEMRRLVAELKAYAPDGGPGDRLGGGSNGGSNGTAVVLAPHAQAELLNLDRRFHALLRQGAHNGLLEAECKMLFNLSLRMWYLFVDRIEPQDLNEDAFTEILEAIENKEVSRADKAMRRHILQFGESIKRYI